MPARETAQRSEETVTPEVAPVEPEAQASELATEEAALPEVAAAPAVAAPATASELAYAEQDASHLDKGMHVNWEHYKAACEQAGKPEKWKDQYKIGHTSAAGWIQPHERYKVYYEWQLQQGTSASKAIQDFVKGPTIAEYRTAAVAQELNDLRNEFGDLKFDKLFGSANSSEDAAIPIGQRLTITPSLYTVPLTDNMRALAKAADDREKPQQEVKPAPVQEARVEEKPKEEAALDQEPLVVAQELGAQQADRELV
jgi:hypothetical protein